MNAVIAFLAILSPLLSLSAGNAALCPNITQRSTMTVVGSDRSGELNDSVAFDGVREVDIKVLGHRPGKDKETRTILLCHGCTVADCTCVNQHIDMSRLEIYEATMAVHLSRGHASGNLQINTSLRIHASEGLLYLCAVYEYRGPINLDQQSTLFPMNFTLGDKLHSTHNTPGPTTPRSVPITSKPPSSAGLWKVLAPVLSGLVVFGAAALCTLYVVRSKRRGSFVVQASGENSSTI